MKKNKKLVLTPRWYSYGGLFHSLSVGLNLAKFYQFEVIVLYPWTHIHKKCAYPAILNQHLKEFVCEDVNIIAGYKSLYSRFFSLWISFNRWVSRSFLGRIFYKLKIQWLIPNFLGFSGLDNPRETQRKIGIKKSIDWSKVYEQRINVDLTDQQKIKAKELFKQLLIPTGVPFICMYIRDGGFEENRKVLGSNICNASLESFYAAVSYLIDKGYYVIRMGDPSMRKCNYEHAHFIDYVHTKAYDHLLDLYLYKNCSFCIGTEGGGRYASYLYNKRTLVANAIEIYASGSSINNDDIFIQKHVFANNKNRFLSLQEQLELMHELHPNKNAKKNYVYVANSDKEILHMIEEDFSSRQTNNFDWNNNLQSQFHRLRRKRMKEVYYNHDKQDWKNLETEQFYCFNPKISRFFIEHCWEYGPYLENLTRNYLNQKQKLEVG